MTTIAVKNTSFEIGYGSVHSEDLGVTPKSLQEIPNRPGYYTDGVYQLNFSVVNVDPSYPGYFEAGIDFGTQELGSCDGWATRTATQITMICPGPGYIVADHALPGSGPVQSGNNLVIHFSVPGWAIKFDNVSLTFTPTQ